MTKKHMLYEKVIKVYPTGEYDRWRSYARFLQLLWDFCVADHIKEVRVEKCTKPHTWLLRVIYEGEDVDR